MGIIKISSDKHAIVDDEIVDVIAKYNLLKSLNCFEEFQQCK